MVRRHFLLALMFTVIFASVQFAFFVEAKEIHPVLRACTERAPLFDPQGLPFLFNIAHRVFPSGRPSQSPKGDAWRGLNKVWPRRLEARAIQLGYQSYADWVATDNVNFPYLRYQILFPKHPPTRPFPQYVDVVLGGLSYSIEQIHSGEGVVKAKLENGHVVVLIEAPGQSLSFLMTLVQNRNAIPGEFPVNDIALGLRVAEDRILKTIRAQMGRPNPDQELLISRSGLSWGGWESIFEGANSSWPRFDRLMLYATGSQPILKHYNPVASETTNRILATEELLASTLSQVSGAPLQVTTELIRQQKAIYDLALAAIDRTWESAYRFDFSLLFGALAPWAHGFQRFGISMMSHLAGRTIIAADFSTTVWLRTLARVYRPLSSAVYESLYRFMASEADRHGRKADPFQIMGNLALFEGIREEDGISLLRKVPKSTFVALVLPELDDLVPPGQYLDLVTALEERGGPFIVFYVPNLIHDAFQMDVELARFIEMESRVPINGQYIMVQNDEPLTLTSHRLKQMLRQKELEYRETMARRMLGR